MAEVQSRLDVATAERDLLTQQQTDAKQRLQVDFILSPKSLLPNQHFNASRLSTGITKPLYLSSSGVCSTMLA